MKINVHKKRVEEILIAHPETRDNNRKLLSIYWSYECEDKGLTPNIFLIYLSNGQLSTPESITRASRKLQEDNVHLRGEKRNERIAHQEEVKKELGYKINKL